MRISDVEKWAACEMYAVQDAGRGAEGVASAVALVGILAHGLVSGDDDIVDRLCNERYVWDSLTSTYAMAAAQAKLIASSAINKLRIGGWMTIEVEGVVADDLAHGRYDLHVWHKDRGDALIELKTGRTPGSAAWLQVAAYISGSDTDIRWGGVLHVPRGSLSAHPLATLEVRRAGALLLEWQTLAARIAKVQGGSERAIRTPGLHCNRCRVEGCAVRIMYLPRWAVIT